MVFNKCSKILKNVFICSFFVFGSIFFVSLWFQLRNKKQGSKKYSHFKQFFIQTVFYSKVLENVPFNLNLFICIIREYSINDKQLHVHRRKNTNVVIAFILLWESNRTKLCLATCVLMSNKMASVLCPTNKKSVCF